MEKNNKLVRNKLQNNCFYYIVESKILKIHSKIVSISSLVKISVT